MSSYYVTVPWVDLGHQTTAPEPPPAPKCPTKYRLKTMEEMGGGYAHWMDHAGKEVIVRGWGTMDAVLIEIPGVAEMIVMEEWLVGTTQHDFVDTGTRRSWCRNCNADGEWDPTQGVYQEKP